MVLLLPLGFVIIHSLGFVVDLPLGSVVQNASYSCALMPNESLLNLLPFKK